MLFDRFFKSRGWGRFVESLFIPQVLSKSIVDRMFSVAAENFFELVSVPKNSHKSESENDYHFLSFFSRVGGLGAKNFPSITMIFHYISHLIVVLIV